MKHITKNSRIFFRADANAHIGHGHVMRLLALAEIVKDHFTYCFVSQNPTPAVEQQIQTLCNEIIKLPTFENVESEANYIAAHILQPGDMLVLDGYQFSAKYQQIIRSAGIKLICMDDLHQIHFYADAVINPAGGVSLQKYEGEIYTRYGLGPTYAPLRTPFRKAAQHRRQKIDRIEQIFICFGGADYYNLTDKITKACLCLNFLKKIHIVAGSAYQHWPSLQEIAERHPEKILIYQNLEAEDMVQLMQQCQLAIAPASTIAYEIGMVGLGLITGISADNQKSIAKYLIEANCATYVGDFHQASAEEIQQCIASYKLPTINEHVFKQSRIFIDNTSVLLKLFQRLALESQIKIRRANFDDLLTYFHWANEPETRKQAVHPDFIDLETHTKWFERKIASPVDFLFIFEINQQPVGQVRFELDQGKYLISFSVDIHFRGKGLGTILIKMALEALQQELGHRPKVKAYVKPTNTASLHVFRQNSFLPKGKKKMNNVLLELFEK